MVPDAPACKCWNEACFDSIPPLTTQLRSIFDDAVAFHPTLRDELGNLEVLCGMWRHNCSVRKLIQAESSILASTLQCGPNPLRS